METFDGIGESSRRALKETNLDGVIVPVNLLEEGCAHREH
jgi:hypothetical protein